MPYENPAWYAWVACTARAYDPATVHDDRSPSVIAPRARHSPLAIGADSDTNATLRGIDASAPKRSCGRSNDVVVIRLNCPSSCRSARIDDATRADSPTARPSPAIGLSAGSDVSSPGTASPSLFNTLRFRCRSRHASSSCSWVVLSFVSGSATGSSTEPRPAASTAGESAASDGLTSVIVKSLRTEVL